MDDAAGRVARTALVERHACSPQNRQIHRGRVSYPLGSTALTTGALAAGPRGE
jgi:hypothetical protein